MENAPPLTGKEVIGYRTLTQGEVELMNEGKALAEHVGAWITKLRSMPAAQTDRATNKPFVREGAMEIDQRWVSIGATHLQEGFMAAIRGITKPQSF